MVFYLPGTEFSWFRSMRQRSRRLQTQEPVAVIIRDQGASFSVVESVAQPPSPPPSSFICPICFEPLVNETATKCGHVFCQRCIGSAIRDQPRCPICRLRLTHQDLIRVYLPPSPPQLPTFPCPICLRQVVDATATNCGHIFCEGCIQLAAFNRPECPKCMLLVSHQDLFRIYIP
ncbi:zinc finger, RING/FYVE/PHD-type [Artemisia annua]|uniref:Zinc finger, RING/FYVE/PHD-type n=1 Tax=Artemisia annua TaxID=35608 RepID=A0A2U1MBI6_ARTAN|nr:zinc finger, RING/FYVE/PHD-type [Artemisia annua]